MTGAIGSFDYRLSLRSGTAARPPTLSRFCEPLVLGAVPIKSELLAEVQSGDRKAYETISDQWAEAACPVTQTTELVVAGYCFPPEDGYVLLSAARSREAGARRSVARDERTKSSIIRPTRVSHARRVKASSRRDGRPCAPGRRGSTGLRVAQKAPSPRARKTCKNPGIRPRGAEKQA